MPKIGLGIDVLTAARERIAWTFDTFPKIYVSFSGGKDSTVMLHLVMDEAIKRNRKVGLFFLDWECQFTITINHIRAMFEKYAAYAEPYWIAVPIRTWNGCSQHEPEWIAWDEAKKNLWVRQKEPMSIQDKMLLPFYYPNMMFEEFTPLFGQWFAGGEQCASFIGIRTVESLNRFRTIARDKPTMEGRQYTTNVIDNVWNVYPIYDWEPEDDWTYCAKFKQPYNPLYDRMYQAGLTISQMRIDEPFGDTQRQGLWLYQMIEPEMWAKMVKRVAGANTGAMYSGERGNILGNNKLSLPKGHTWQSFANLLLHTMPPPTAEHYRNKLAVYLKWFRERGYPDGIPDQAPYELETEGKVPSWRRICKALLRNDYWCRSLGFSPTKSAAYKHYLEMMRKRRNNWGIYPLKQEKANESAIEQPISAN